LRLASIVFGKSETGTSHSLQYCTRGCYFELVRTQCKSKFKPENPGLQAAKTRVFGFGKTRVGNPRWNHLYTSMDGTVFPRKQPPSINSFKNHLEKLRKRQMYFFLDSCPPSHMAASENIQAA